MILKLLMKKKIYQMNEDLYQYEKIKSQSINPSVNNIIFDSI